MAQPKRRWSKARTHLKRSTWKLESQNLVDCPHCHEKRNDINESLLFYFYLDIYLVLI